MQCVFSPSLVTFKMYFLFQNFDYDILQCGFSLGWFFLGFIKIVGSVDFWYSSKVQQFAYYIFKYFSSFFLISEILYIYTWYCHPTDYPYYVHFILVFLVSLLHIVQFLSLCLQVYGLSFCFVYYACISTQHIFLFRYFSIYSSFICLLETLYCSIIFMFSLLLWSYFFKAVSNSFVF